MCSVGLIEIIAGIQIVLAADLKSSLFIPGSDLQDFTFDLSLSISPTFDCNPESRFFGICLLPLLLLSKARLVLESAEAGHAAIDRPTEGWSKAERRWGRNTKI